MNLRTACSSHWESCQPAQRCSHCWIWKKSTMNPGQEMPRACCQVCFPRLTGKPSREQSSSLGKHPMLSLCQLGSICFITIPNLSFGLMSTLRRSKWSKWYPESLGSPDMNHSQWNLIYTSPLLPCMWTPWTYSSIRALDSLKVFAVMKPAAFSAFPQQLPGPSSAPLCCSGWSHPPTELLAS